MDLREWSRLPHTSMNRNSSPDVLCMQSHPSFHCSHAWSQEPASKVTFSRQRMLAALLVRPDRGLTLAMMN